jgi:hypothetical protein
MSFGFKGFVHGHVCEITKLITEISERNKKVDGT